MFAGQLYATGEAAARSSKSTPFNGYVTADAITSEGGRPDGRKRGRGAGPLCVLTRRTGVENNIQPQWQRVDTASVITGGGNARVASIWDATWAAKR